MKPSVETGVKYPFLPVETKPLDQCSCGSITLLDTKSLPPWVQQLAMRTELSYLNPQHLDVFVWPKPLVHTPKIPYPEKLRSFTPTEIDSRDRINAIQLIRDYGPFISLHPSEWEDAFVSNVLSKEKHLHYHEVPDHQARGFHHDALAVWKTSHGNVRLTSTVCTKGNGTTGYWIERRQKEMIEALEQDKRDYPLNPDPIHARDHSGQSVGQKNGDEIVLVGGASATVTKREVEGFTIYEDSHIFSPVCMPPRIIKEIPLGSGKVIPSEEFLSHFASREQLVYLAKAWGNELRIWRNHISDRFMTATHLVSAKDGESWIFQRVLDDLQSTVAKRKQLLQSDDDATKAILQNVPMSHWYAIIGPAALCLQSSTIFSERTQPIIPHILSFNMIENTAQAAINRLWGKPVAWHLENIGRWGEVSGGERIYGMNAHGIPSGTERNFFFACLFDGYMATAIEWAATSPREYISFAEHYQITRLRVLSEKPNHWLQHCPTVESLISYCKQEKPDYEVKFRSEDAYPLVAVSAATAAECTDQHEDGSWKNWDAVMRNAHIFLSGIRTIYQKTYRD